MNPVCEMGYSRRPVHWPVYAVGLWVVLAVILSMTGVAHAQLPGLGSSRGDAGTGYQALIDQARQQGATVIVIEPHQQPAPPAFADMMAPQLRLLEARAALVAMIERIPTTMMQTAGRLETLSPDGTNFWLWRSIGVALLGIAVGFLANRAIGRWLRCNFAGARDPDPQTSAQKISHLMLRSSLAIARTVIGFCIAIIVAVIFDIDHEPSRATIFAIVSAYFAYRGIRYGFMLNLFAPDLPNHRMITVNDKAARSLYNGWWCVLIIICVLFGLARWSRAVELPADTINLLYIAAIVTSGLLITVLTICHRKAYGEILAGESGQHRGDDGRRVFEFAAVVLAVVYLVGAALLSIYRILLGYPGEFIVIMAPVMIAMAAGATYGIAFVVIDWIYARRCRLYRERYEAALEHKRQEETEARAAFERLRADQLSENEDMQMMPPTVTADPVFEYKPIFREFFERSVVGLIAVVSLGELARSVGVEMGREGGHPFAEFLDMLLIAYVAYQLLKAFNRYIDEKIRREGGTPGDEEAQPGDGEGGTGQSRLATLLPIARNVVVAIVVVIAATIALSNMGVDVAPLFAGAGVIGIAIGFGAQTLIRDIFSGAFFLLDDAFRKGEYVELSGVKGVVEKISIRSFQLRHHLGALHTIPFGEITSLTNYSRDWVMMKLPIRLTYDTDVDRVRKLIKTLGQELLDHPDIGPSFLQPLKSQGVYKMEDSAMIIRVKFMTKPGEQFVVRKLVYERIRQLFEREGIPFASREVTVRLHGQPNADELSDAQKQAVSAAARRVIDDEDERPQGQTPGLAETGR